MRSRRDAQEVDNAVQGDASVFLMLDRFCQQIAALLPTISASTRRAIFCCFALLVAWRVILWALEMVVTSVCFAVALGIIVCFVRPDLALMLVTEVLPPHLDAARGWLSSTFLSAGLSLTRRPLVIPHAPPVASPAPLALEETLLLPPRTPPSQRNLRTVQHGFPSDPEPGLRPRGVESQPAMVEATA